MPRKAFVADLGKAVSGVSIAGISDVRAGNDDGEFTFQCVADGTKLEISALITDVSEYPSSHMCMIFAGSSAPEKVADILQDITDAATGKSVAQILELVSQKLESTDSDGDKQMIDSQGYSDDEFGTDDDEDDAEEYFPDDDFLPKPVLASKDPGTTLEAYTKPTSAFRQRIRTDLRKAKAAGFKIGHHGGLLDGLGCYVSLSCRVSKLGISEEAMQAWQIEPNEYLVAILHYPNGYKTMDTIKSCDAPTARRYFSIRVGVSTTYKPTMQEAVQAFTVLSKEDEKRREQSQNSDLQQKDTQVRGFRNSFISRPLNELLEERFSTVLGYRYEGMPWRGAEAYYNDHIGTNHAQMAIKEEYYVSDQANVAYPPIVTADHIIESATGEHSLPLVGMQFVLRHFVRCTEFCLICFTKMSDDLQAIKPYVCDKPLCLYQYMSLGFGPSIEHEILSQPKVVDLLISFCYTSARLGKLSDFPTGLSLMVPPTIAYEKDYGNTQYDSYSTWVHGSTQQTPPAASTPPQACPMRFNVATKEIIFDKREDKCPLRTGDWIVIRTDDDPTRPFHCRVANTTFYPTIQVAEPVRPALTTMDPSTNTYPYPPPAVSTPPQKPPQAQAPSGSSEFRPAAYFAYDQNFDELHDYHKRTAISALLDALPRVSDMKNYLVRKAQSPLSSWVDRLSPAATGILRWIIASNRACIMQVADEGESESGKKGEERLYGMAGWSQFRFAMGAPDKERRFLQAVRDTTDRLKLKHSTLFAWHGSPINNWHSIIREGLHFKDTAHGRAYGHGVYHSLDVHTSIGYSSFGPGTIHWPMSDLRVSQALALNEIVNAPKEFVSSSPHLVVAQLDWIQTRYLFVKTQASSVNTSNSKESKPADFIEQDPNMTPRGSTDSIVIPVHAIAGSRRPQTRTVKNSTSKRRKTLGTGSTAYDPINLDGEDDDGASVCTLDEDRIILEDEPTFEPDPLPTPNSTKGKSKAGNFLSKLVGSKSSPKPLTDFVGGTLDFSTLPMLKAPQWATPAATKRLMKDFKDLVKVQNREPPYELGWYIDPERHDNMYQWIVEMHSFDPTLPLAKDMKTQNHKSIVLELRFGNQYPMAPPFVRVIRPKFLGFNQGGGGHVTLGGAMCMQLLTNDGWLPTSSLESVLLQVRMAMSSLDPRPARLETGGRGEYGIGEAIEAYLRACAVHGWTAPPGFREMAMGGQGNAGSHSFY
ncbi:hypothetical protein K491DRAFT_722312 [Lophiostoma macrostomum CBS 122681]|uniref:UBC core domain-containing protein n=1 Tax=Lophiostoma macrostomum CBS 122681 TaxID=1314788 RepID=A0A6A6SMM0_9PLEO|nr:hypothetical protein K491DRAFT_722312 [Lophiostoma macrostomum CBS 122681]